MENLKISEISECSLKMSMYHLTIFNESKDKERISVILTASDINLRFLKTIETSYIRWNSLMYSERFYK